MADALSFVSHLRLHGSTRRCRRHQVAGVLRCRGDPHRGSPPARSLGHPARHVAVRRRAARHQPGRRLNNHNAGKYGITLNLRTDKAKRILEQLIEISDVVSENFAKGVMDRWGFGYERLKAIRPDIVYVSNCGFGHTGPYSDFKTWGPIVQAVSGLTFTSGLLDREPAGWGYSYMDHTGAYYMAMAILMALIHRQRTGEGQWVDLACTESALTLHGPALLDWTVNGRPSRREGQPNANRSQWPAMAPHGIYPCRGEDDWVAIACRDDADWERFAHAVGEARCADPAYAQIASRVGAQDDLDERVGAWTSARTKFGVEGLLRDTGMPVSAVMKPQERIDLDPSTGDFGLWPTVTHPEMGEVRVDGQPVHFSDTDWRITRGGPCLGEHNEEVLTRLLGYSADEVLELHHEGVL